MNTAFLDAHNLAWKIHAVEKGFARRDLLKTYESERRHVAENLLDFDNRYAKLFSQRPPAAGEVRAASSSDSSDNEFIKTFKASCEFTSGYGVAYKPNALNWSSEHPAKSLLIHPAGTKLRTGRIMINANVTRITDANPVHLEQEIPLNGSFRIFIFAGNLEKTRDALRDLSKGLSHKKSFYSAYKRSDIDSVSWFERHNPHSHFFSLATIFASLRRDVEIARDVPEPMSRYRDSIYADDLSDDIVPNSRASAHEKMGLCPENGGVVVVRPDGYVGIVVKLEPGPETVTALNQYFASFCTKDVGGFAPQL